MATILLLAATLAFGAACDSGGGDDDDGATATSTSVRDATPGAGVDGTPASVATNARPTSTPGTTLGLQSFRYTVNLEFNVDVPGDAPDDTAISGVIDGEYVAPDSHAFRQQFEVGGISVSDATIVIGDDAWVRDGNTGPWDELPRSDPGVQDSLDLTSADPDFLGLDEEFLEGISAFESQPAEIGGRSARAYELTQDDIETITGLFGDDFLGGSGIEDIRNLEFRVWLDDLTGSLLRVEMVATLPPDALGADAGFDIPPDALIRFRLEVELSDIDGASISIEAPI